MIVALVVVGVTFGLVFGLKNETHIAAAVVSNGRGCADIGRYELFIIFYRQFFVWVTILL